VSRPQRIHNLAHNVSELTPGRCLFADTETRPLDTGIGEEHTLRLWAAELVERREPSRKGPRATAWTGHTVAQLCAAVEDACRPSETLWVWAHNLGFDLAVTGLPLALVERGWEVTQHALTAGSPWMRMRHGTRSATLVDSHSWLDVPLDRLGGHVGVEKPPLPDWDAPDEVWFERCRADVTILKTAVLELLDWWDSEHLGHWSLTGPGTGFNSYRHRPGRTKVVIDPDPAARTFEREMVYGGRAECWRVGILTPGVYAYLDFEHSFASLATLPLPWRRGPAHDGWPLEHASLHHSRIGALAAEAEVETETPRYPLRTRGGIVHPVGRFVTNLCSPELREAAARGELRAVGRGHPYVVAPHMEPWARWAIGILDDPDQGAPATARIAVKAWTRTVPGRWAGRTGRTHDELEQPVPGWRVERGHQHPGGAPCTTLDMGGRRYTVVQDQEMDNGFPAVLAWIQSYQRVRLSRLIDLVGTDACVLCNTDGLVVDLAAFSARHDPWAHRFLGTQGKLALLEAHLAGWAGEFAPLRPRLKWIAHELEVLSPSHMISEHTRQLSGVPRSATDLGGHRYAFTDWPRLATQLEGGWEGGYTRRHRTVDLSTVPTLRWVLEDGRCVPVGAAGRLGAPSTLLPYPVNGNGAPGAALRAAQHPALSRIDATR
jgi:hypothetical protein